MISIKRLLQIGLILASGVSMPSWAILIDDTNAGILDGTNVGVVDSFIAEDDKVGNPQSEEDWVNSILGTGTVTYTVKNDPVTYFMTDTTDVFAFELESAPEYFLVKNAQRIALFQNLADIDWGVFDTGDLSAAMNLPDFTGEDAFTISHVTEFNGSVPEPGVLGLLGLGMVGIVLGRRRMAA